jgi:L-lactate dehydrogenase complex protein LldF
MRCTASAAARVLNVCPIFKNVGGHTYGTTYQGPIGSVITPHFRGLQNWKHLSGASSLCGACTSACPGEDRHSSPPAAQPPQRRATETALVGGARVSGGGVRFQSSAVVCRPRPFGKLAQKLHPLVEGSLLDPARAWTSHARRTATRAAQFPRSIGP